LEVSQSTNEEDTEKEIVELENTQDLDINIEEQIMDTIGTAFVRSINKAQNEKMHNFIKVKTSGNEKIYIESLRILPEKQRWINDQIVNYYLELLQKFVSDNHSGTLKSMVYAECFILRHIKKQKEKD
jgi:Ulp1 family protease